MDHTAAISEGYCLRRLRTRDAAEFQQLRLAAIAEAPEAFGTSLEEERAKNVRTYQRDLARRGKNHHDFILGAYHPSLDGALIGVVGFFHKKKKTRHKGLFWGMYVVPEHRRVGLGRALIAEAMSECRAISELEMLQISVVTSNPGAQALYEAAHRGCWSPH